MPDTSAALDAVSVPGRVAVLGAGSWGTTVAALVAARVPAVLWARSRVVAREVNDEHRNTAYLGERPLPESLRGTGDLDEALDGASVVFTAVPSHGFRAIFTSVAERLDPAVPVISLSKGLEDVSLARMTEIVEELSPGQICGVLTGPNLASEVLDGQPTASVVAASDHAAAETVQRILLSPTLRVYTNSDVIGCEIAGCLKNVMAIAAGMADGLGFGDNTRAALITRGLAEMGRLGVALGGRPLTFAGLAGMGDLVATCTSPRSRNHYVGVQLGKGRCLDDILEEMRMVAEGVKTAHSAVELGRRNGVAVPISSQVDAVLSGRASAGDALVHLVSREVGAEMEGIEA